MILENTVRNLKIALHTETEFPCVFVNIKGEKTTIESREEFLEQRVLKAIQELEEFIVLEENKKGVRDAQKEV